MLFRISSRERKVLIAIRCYIVCDFFLIIHFNISKRKKIHIIIVLREREREIKKKQFTDKKHHSNSTTTTTTKVNS